MSLLVNKFLLNFFAITALKKSCRIAFIVSVYKKILYIEINGMGNQKGKTHFGATILLGSTVFSQGQLRASGAVMRFSGSRVNILSKRSSAGFGNLRQEKNC